MSEKAVVTRRAGDMLTLTLTRREACGHCRACIAGFAEKEMILEAKNELRGTELVDELLDIGHGENNIRMILKRLVRSGSVLCSKDPKDKRYNYYKFAKQQ